MYLRWRGSSLGALRDSPEAHRDPATVGETFDPTDGRVDVVTDGGVAADPGAVDRDPSEPTVTPVTDGAAESFDDPWAAEQFLESIDGTAYGTTPETLREGLELVVARDRVWLSPGIPFLVPMFVGLVLAFTYGDVLFGLLGVLGVA
jgi:preflagellin peptidase FlaK